MATIRGGRYLEVSRLVGVGAQGGGGGGGEAAGVRLEPVLRQDAFSTLRSLCKIRPVGASKVGQVGRSVVVLSLKLHRSRHPVRSIDRPSHSITRAYVSPSSP